MKRTYNYRIDETFEELGRQQHIAVDGHALVDVWPGEKQTWDYPGAPPTAEVTDWFADAFEAYDDDLELVYRVERRERPDWFAWLDKIMLRKAQDESRIDDYMERASELALNDSHD